MLGTTSIGKMPNGRLCNSLNAITQYLPMPLCTSFPKPLHPFARTDIFPPSNLHNKKAYGLNLNCQTLILLAT